MYVYILRIGRMNDFEHETNTQFKLLLVNFLLANINIRNLKISIIQRMSDEEKTDNH